MPVARKRRVMTSHSAELTGSLCVLWCIISGLIQRRKSSNILADIWKYRWCFSSSISCIGRTKETYLLLSQRAWFRRLTYQPWWCCCHFDCCDLRINKVVTSFTVAMFMCHIHTVAIFLWRHAQGGRLSSKAYVRMVRWLKNLTCLPSLSFDQTDKWADEFARIPQKDTATSGILHTKYTDMYVNNSVHGAASCLWEHMLKKQVYL